MSDTTVHLQHCLERLQAGDPAAREELIRAACERLTRLARKMLKADGRLRRWEETGDVLQSGLMRLYRALETVHPASLREFYRLAALQIRRELIDLARRHYGPAGHAARHDSRPPDPAGDTGPQQVDAADTTLGPDRLALWAEFHEQIGRLPGDERDVFELVWYQGLTHAEAAGVLGLSTKTIQRRWQAGCLKLHEALHGELPGL